MFPLRNRYFCKRNYYFGMTNPALQQDTLLKQLHQAVELPSAQTLDITRKLIEPTNIRHMDSISKRDTLREKRTQTFIQRNQYLPHQQVLTLPPIVGIQPNEIILHTGETSKTSLILPLRRIEKSSPDWVVGIFLLALILFASVRLFFNKYLVQLIQAAVNYATATRLFRERSVSLTHASFRLDLIFYITFSLFLFQSAKVFGIHASDKPLVLYLLVLAGVVCYFGLKRLFYLFQGNLTESLPETHEFLFNMSIYNRILGLVLLPVCMVVAFSPISSPQWVVRIGMMTIAVFYILLIFRGIRILISKHFSIFYLILYLCALEILPLLVICKLALI